jgi:hypothetical protein
MDELKGATGSGAPDKAGVLDKAGAGNTGALEKYEAPRSRAAMLRAAIRANRTSPCSHPFGPLIAQAVMPATLIERINRCGDQVVGDRPGKEFLACSPPCLSTNTFSAKKTSAKFRCPR